MTATSGLCKKPLWQHKKPMDQHINLDSLEEIPLSIEDLDLFSAKDPSGACRFNAPIPFGNAPELRFIIQDFLPLGVLGMVVATGGSGKTMLLTQMAYAVASGRDFWNMKTGEPKTVLYVYAEETNAEIHRRLDRIRERNLEESECINLHRLCGYGLDLRFKLEERDNFSEQLEKYICRFRPSLVILDPAAQFNCAENENDSVQSNTFIRLLRKLTEYGSTIIIAHHTSKFGSNQSDQHSSRGSSALTDGARWVLNLTGYDSGKNWKNDLREIDGNEIWQYKKAEITKVNNFMPSAKTIYLKNAGSGVLDTGPDEEFKLTEVGRNGQNRNNNGVQRRPV